MFVQDHNSSKKPIDSNPIITKTIYETKTKYDKVNMIEFDEKYEAPALARGLGLLKIMVSEEEFSLENLAEITNTPKSSLLRLLDTLQKLDFVYKDDSTKMYSSVKVILEKERLGENHLSKNLPAIMTSICKRLSRSVEWYIPTEVGMTLIDRYVPQDQEVQVRAKIGFIRQWGTELEAVSNLGYAFGNSNIRNPSKLYKVNEKEEKIDLSLEDIKKNIENAQLNKYVYDKHYNSNGIRRAAIPILKKQILIGILAVAEHKSFSHPVKGKDLISVLQNEFKT